MKKILFKANFMFMFAFVFMFNACASKQVVATPQPAPVAAPAEQQPVSRNQDRIQAMEDSLKLIELENKIRLAKVKAAAELRKATLDAIPCYEQMLDSDDFFAALGVSTEHVKSEEDAKSQALKNAQQEARRKIGGEVQGIVTDYSNYYRGSTPTASTQKKVEDMFEQVIERVLNDTKTVCAERYVRPDIDRGFGVEDVYKYYVAIHIDKKQFVDEMKNALSNEEKTEIDFRAAEFQKFFEKRMREYKESKEAATDAIVEKLNE